MISDDINYFIMRLMKMEIRVLTKDDFDKWAEQFLHLYKLSFNGEMNKEILKWRYLDNPYDDFLVVVAIDNNNKIIGNCAASPLEIVENGVTYRAALAMNTMVHPDYRGKGVFVSLARKLNEIIEKKGYKLVFSFPNYLSNPIYVKKLGRTVIYEVPTMVLDLKNYKGDKIDTSVVSEDDEFHFQYNPERYSSKSIYIKKSTEFLKWRYAKNVSNDYKNFIIKNGNDVRAYLVCKEYEEKLNIVDIGLVSINDFVVLINKAINYANILNKKEVTIWSQIGTEEHLELERLKFRNNYPITYFSAKVFDKSARSIYYDYRNWLIQQGDNNVY